MVWLPPVVIALVILRLGAQLALEALNRAEARRHAGQRPAALAVVFLVLFLTWKKKPAGAAAH